MATVNYVREHMRFIEYASDENVTAAERLLWYALMHIMNQRAQGCEWPDDFIRIGNDRLLSLCPMTLETLAKARNRLKQRGLIDFQNGEKNKKHPAYKVCYFFPDGNAMLFCPNFSGNNMDNIGDNSMGNYGDNSTGNYGDNNGYNIINLNNNQTYTPVEEEEEQETDRQKSARARAERIETAWKTHFGSDPTPATVQWILRIGTTAEMEDAVLNKAIEMSAGCSPRNAAEYTVAILDDWRKNGVKTVKDAEEYAFISDAVNGRIEGITLAKAYLMREKFRERRA